MLSDYHLNVLNLPYTNYKGLCVSFACSDFVPEKVRAEDALREISSRGNGGG